MSPNRLIFTGGAMCALGLICCFTPLLPMVLGGLGLTGLFSILYNDAVLLPIAGLGFALALYGIWKRQRAKA